MNIIQALVVAIALSGTSLEPEDPARFRFEVDKQQRIVSAEYCEEAMVEALVKAKKARPEDFHPIEELKALPCLKRLVFPYGSDISAQEIEAISNLSHLVEIEMGFPAIDSEYVTIEGDLLKLGRLKHLEVLRLCKDGIFDLDIKFIPLLPSLHTFELNGDNGQKDAPVCTDRCAGFLSRAKKLKHLTIYDGDFQDKFVARVTQGLPQLESLSLKSQKLTDESLRLIAERCRKLKKLSISSNKITQEGVKHLAKLEHLKECSVQSRLLPKKK